MGRFNLVWKTLRTLCVIMCIVWAPARSFALGGTGMVRIPFGSCSLDRINEKDGYNGGYGSVQLNGAVPGQYWYSGGFLFYEGNYKDTVAEGWGGKITKEAIADCLGMISADVLSVSSDEVDLPPSYLNQIRMGFSFTLSTASPDGVYGQGITHEFYIGGANTAPTADAGDDQTNVASAATVTLNGTGSSDPDAGDALSYAWTQTDSTGRTVTLSSASTDKPTFTAPTLNIGDPDATIVFSLTVNDGTVNSTADTVSITVKAPSPTTTNTPTALVATPGDGLVSVAFTAPTDTGGAAITDYEYQLDGSAWTSSGKTSSPVVITGLTNGTSYSIKLRAVNSAGKGAASEAVSVLLGSPASAFEEAEEEVQAIITQDATRSLTSTLSSNQRMTRDARERFIESRGQG